MSGRRFTDRLILAMGLTASIRVLRGTLAARLTDPRIKPKLQADLDASVARLRSLRVRGEARVDG